MNNGAPVTYLGLPILAAIVLKDGQPSYAFPANMPRHQALMLFSGITAMLTVDAAVELAKNGGEAPRILPAAAMPGSVQ